jgi:ATP phosphoribosyltransferase regulatory subunit
MALADRWLLPDGMKELLPPVAREVELVRRRMLDLYDSWGYELVMPPVAEHLESLLTGVGRDLGLQTFKVTDEVSGHMLGIRADITPQVARIDAHRLRSDGVSRLCYCGSVLHTRPVNMLASRNPMQLGAELFGHEGVDSDAEVISLMLETLVASGVQGSINLDLGHVGVFTELVQAAGLSSQQTETYIDILQRKALPELAPFVASLNLSSAQAEQLNAVARLNGGYEVLERALELFSESSEIVAAIRHLQQLAQLVGARYPEIGFYFDLGELRGYNYHTGVVFAAYSPRFGQALAKGGRYDQIGADFGRARAATGFSTDLKTLVMLALETQPAVRAAILAPADTEAALLETIRQLRVHGERVVIQLAGAQTPEHCDRQLVKNGTEWVLEAL